MQAGEIYIVHILAFFMQKLNDKNAIKPLVHIWSKPVESDDNIGDSRQCTHLVQKVL